MNLLHQLTPIYQLLWQIFNNREITEKKICERTDIYCHDRNKWHANEVKDNVRDEVNTPSIYNTAVARRPSGATW